MFKGGITVVVPHWKQTLVVCSVSYAFVAVLSMGVGEQVEEVVPNASLSTTLQSNFRKTVSQGFLPFGADASLSVY